MIAVLQSAFMSMSMSLAVCGVVGVCVCVFVSSWRKLCSFVTKQGLHAFFFPTSAKQRERLPEPGYNTVTEAVLLFFF